jgi:Uma2 family endonuclease
MRRGENAAKAKGTPLPKPCPFGRIRDMSVQAATYKFTAEEFYRLYETGLLDAKDRIELLNGELIVMHAIGYRHAQAVTNLTSEFGEQARRRYMISPQNPVELERYSAPQPDLVLVPTSRRHARRHPTPDEVFLIIEVADSSLRYDREDKQRAYAATGIREFWLLNLEDDVLEIYRQPEGPAYREHLTVADDGTAAPLAFPDVTIAVAEILPPR